MFCMIWKTCTDILSCEISSSVISYDGHFARRHFVYWTFRAVTFRHLGIFFLVFRKKSAYIDCWRRFMWVYNTTYASFSTSRSYVAFLYLFSNCRFIVMLELPVSFPLQSTLNTCFSVSSFAKKNFNAFLPIYFLFLGKAYIMSYQRQLLIEYRNFCIEWTMYIK